MAAKGTAKGSRKAPSPEAESPAGARPSWRGMISFGLVNVPVNLYTAVKPELHEMNYLRKNDLCPISYKKVCRFTGEEVPFKDIVRGYEYKEGDFVVLDDEDFKKADVKKTSTIDIAVFVDEKDVDPKYMEKPYYLEPEKKAQKPYALFREAMARSAEGRHRHVRPQGPRASRHAQARRQGHPAHHAPLRRVAPGPQRSSTSPRKPMSPGIRWSWPST